ncbi:hypothetical protein [Novosphingobium sp. 9]|uniref:hypothetical protein n=1 Tax=Novosphingobium sp. 9 TaxID=2025349 RepID=UPI0021B50C8D|nr:hypothetical protein [Novosphingobium sp. 9]
MSAGTGNDTASRRRWITFGEIVAVIALVISGLTLWNNWSQRSDDEADKAAVAEQASTRAGTLVLSASGAGSDRLALRPVSADQVVQSQEIAFPSALDLTPASTTGEPRIEASWFESALKQARDKAGLPDDSRGDERLPVVITTQYMVDGRPFENVSLYDVGYTITGRWFAGHSLKLRGLSFVSSTTAAKALPRLDARWKTMLASQGGKKKKG